MSYPANLCPAPYSDVNSPWWLNIIQEPWSISFTLGGDHKSMWLRITDDTIVFALINVAETSKGFYTWILFAKTLYSNSSRSLDGLLRVDRLSSNNSRSLISVGIYEGTREGEEAAMLWVQWQCDVWCDAYKAMKMKDSLVNFKLQDPPNGALSSHWLSL